MAAIEIGNMLSICVCVCVYVIKTEQPNRRKLLENYDTFIFFVNLSVMKIGVLGGLWMSNASQWYLNFVHNFNRNAPPRVPIERFFPPLLLLLLAYTFSRCDLLSMATNKPKKKKKIPIQIDEIGVVQKSAYCHSISAFITFTFETLLPSTRTAHPPCRQLLANSCVISWQFEANWSFFYNQFDNACQYNLSRTLLTMPTNICWMQTNISCFAGRLNSERMSEQARARTTTMIP